MKRFAFTAAAFEGSLAVLAAALGAILGIAPLKTFRVDAAGLAWGVAATLPPLALFGLCLIAPLRPLRKISQIVDQLLVPLFRGCRVIELAMIAALAGLGEEMLFRGIVQTWLSQAVGGLRGTWLGLLVAGGLFGLLHPITSTYALLATLIGIYLGAVWLASGNLLAPILAHGLYDFLILLYLVKFKRQGRNAE